MPRTQRHNTVVVRLTFSNLASLKLLTLIHNQVDCTCLIHSHSRIYFNKSFDLPFHYLSSVRTEYHNIRHGPGHRNPWLRSAADERRRPRERCLDGNPSASSWTTTEKSSRCLSGERRHVGPAPLCTWHRSGNEDQLIETWINPWTF